VPRDFKTLGFEVLQGYGLPEAASMITFTRHRRWKIGAAGPRMPCLEMKTAEGEIVARGRNILHEAPAPTADMAVPPSVICKSREPASVPLVPATSNRKYQVRTPISFPFALFSI